MSATQALGESIKTRLAEVDVELAAAEQSIKPLKEERTALRKSLSEIEKLFGLTSSNGGGAKDSGEEIGYDTLLEIVNKAEGSVTTATIATQLGVKATRIARKLKKMADEGQILGSKEAGWSAREAVTASEPAVPAGPTLPTE